MTTNPPGGEAVRPPIDALREQRLREILDPAHSALLVIDVQNDLFSPDGKFAANWGRDISAMQAIVPKIEEVTNLFYGFHRPVIRTITHEDPELRNTAGQDRFLFFEDGDRDDGVAFLSGTPGAELYLPAKPGDIVIPKTKNSAFVGTNLPNVIREQGIRTMFVVGAKSDRCVSRTVQDLYERADIHVVVLEDCVASDDQQQHQAALKELKDFYPPVITSQQLEEDWSRRLTA